MPKRVCGQHHIHHHPTRIINIDDANFFHQNSNALRVSAYSTPEQPYSLGRACKQNRDVRLEEMWRLSAMDPSPTLSAGVRRERRKSGTPPGA